MKFYLLVLAGFAVTTLIKLHILNLSTPMLTPQETMRVYWKKNVFYSTANLIIGTVFSFLLTVPGSEWFVKLFSGGQIPTDTPFGIYLFSFLVIGVGGEVIAGWVANFKNPMKVSASNPVIQEVKQETVTESLEEKNQLKP
jgi:hypothetical protein